MFSESEANIAQSPIKLPFGIPNLILNLRIVSKIWRGILATRCSQLKKNVFANNIFVHLDHITVYYYYYYYSAKSLKPKSALIWDVGMLCLHSGQRLMFKLHLGYWRSWNVGYQGRRSGGHWHSGKERARALNSTKFHLETLITSLNTANTIRYMLLIGW